MLLWPAVWNGYPIVFADTGTYLSQAIHRYAGWDRPVFYSVFMLALHWTRTVWPVVIAQALLAAWMLWLTWRVLAPNAAPRGFLVLIALLAVGTWLPWLTSELMPDLFTPLLVLTLCLLGWAPEALSSWQRLALLSLATLFIMTQQSSLPLAAGITLFIMTMRWVSGRRQRLTLGNPLADLELQGPPSGDMRSRDGSVTRRYRDFQATRRPWRVACLALPTVLAPLLMCATNLVAHHRFALSPYGNVFLLARVIYDGPGLTVLQRDCELQQWRLCLYRDRLPGTSDEFLWRADSPVQLAGGPKHVSEEAGAIIAAALLADPVGQARASLANSWAQLLRFAGGDGLQPWPDQVTPWVRRDLPPREAAAYQAARQQTGQLAVPGWMAIAHRIVAIAGVIVCGMVLALGWAQPHWSAARHKARRWIGFGLDYRQPDDAKPKQASEVPLLSRFKNPSCRNPVTPHAACPDRALMAPIAQPTQGRLSFTDIVRLRSRWMLTMLFTLPLCAVITGALSGPHDRYQARVMWLPALLAIIPLVGGRPR